ncbi:hypothetical protein HED55_07670 [Ochrobactrum haematophilum]|uniref:Uncharacterized protein n=1 Tax=Brucella haematophila TaxID=419474 RepID=A0ABX1DPS1_9HYPH|nr:hypothetical protein [Brucella haematophila]
MPVKETRLEMTPGSPLDFSSILPNSAIDEQSRIAANAAGRLVRAAKPDEPQRLFCASLSWRLPSAGKIDHAFIDRYVRQLRLHGYNIARLHFLDTDLMLNRDGDFNFDPEALDRIRYLMAALKREGIYWTIDGLTAESGALGGRDMNRWGPEGNLKRRIYVDDTAFEHWLRFQKEVYATVNPYTGLAPLQDPALALIIPFNENGIEFTSFLHGKQPDGPFWPGFAPAFNAFLKNVIPTRLHFHGPGAVLPQRKSSKRERCNCRKAVPAAARGGMHDFQAFVVEREQALAARLEAAYRALGYKGLIAPYNNWFTVQTALSRMPQQAISANTYHDWTGSMEPGTTMKQNSSIADAASYVSASWPLAAGSVARSSLPNTNTCSGTVIVMKRGWFSRPMPRCRGGTVFAAMGRGRSRLPSTRQNRFVSASCPIHSRSIRWRVRAKRLPRSCSGAAMSKRRPSRFPS